MKIKRIFQAPQKTFLLLGPRGTGKTTWLQTALNPKVFVNLLHSEHYLRYQADPSRLRQDLSHLAPGDWVVIDEAQRVPELLNEVHSLYQSHEIHFAITGSSARKLKRSQANLLAGRALRCDFFPFVHAELRDPGLLPSCIEFGSLPPVITDPSHARETLSSYIETYLKEEVAAEALTRQLEPFARFLRVAAQHHGQNLNVEAIAREAMVKRRTVDNYFQILEDTLLGYQLPALKLKWRNKETAHPKFYFFDAGVARAAAGWLREEMPDSWRGYSFETFVINEVRAYNSYQKKDRALFHYDVAGGMDIDLLIETGRKVLQRPPTYIAIEIKLARRWQNEWSKPLKALVSDPKSKVTAAYGVYLGDRVQQDEGIALLPFDTFSQKLWNGEIF
jgi:predicted AAA+ superfamily ATPase